MKNTKTLLALTLPLLLVLGCGRTTHSSANTSGETVTSDSATIAKAPSSCDTIKSHLNDASAQKVEAEQHFDVERDLQQVVRTDCSGKVISDKIETVVNPRADITLKAPLVKSFQSVFVFNEATCDHLLTTMPIHNWPLIGELYPVTGNGQDKIQIKGDISKALLTFQLQNGMNKIFVRYFYDCSPENVEGNSHSSVGESSCLQSKDSAIIEYPITVSYTEKTIPGTKNVAPTADECSAQKK